MSYFTQAVRRAARVAGVLLGALVSSVALADTITYFHNDIVGSPIAASNASGNVIWREAYRPYGERLQMEPASATNTIWFTSRKEDARSELVYMGARWYDPRIGRFMATDAARFDPGNTHSFNRFAYANNNPYKYRDPDGRWGMLVGVGIRVAGGAAAAARVGAIAQELLGPTVGLVTGCLLVGYCSSTGGNDGTKPAPQAGAGAASGGALPPDDEDPERSLTREEKKSIRSYERRIAEHEEKLSEFKANPTVRPGMEGQPQEVIEQQQADRIRHLENEIRTFRANIEKIRGGT